ncbi:MAG: site-specific integrase [Planctomycetes bacterium]|nr:site-specific integrase [Planctomycetota bacterium]
MTRKPKKIPKHCHHRHTNQGYVRLDGETLYTGVWGKPETDAKYDRLIAEWLASGRVTQRTSASAYEIRHLVADYWTHIQSYYANSKEPVNIRYALRPLVRLYGPCAAEDFGPRQLRAVREDMVSSDLSRTMVNRRIGMIRRMVRWAVSEELVPPQNAQALDAVEPLRRGRTSATESDPVQPVPREIVAATLHHVSRQVAAMIRLQLLTGMRSCEVVTMRPCDIEQRDHLWRYTPKKHKTQHHGRRRTILLNEQCIDVVRPFLLRSEESFLFDPREADFEHRLARGDGTTDSVSRESKRRIRPHYDSQTYGRAIARACKRAGIPHWFPLQLRHTAATEIRALHGIEAARAVLGHAEARTTEIYAERDEELAKRIMIART